MDLFLHFISTLVSISGLSQQSPIGLGFGASIGLHEAKHSDPDTSKVIPDDGFARNCGCDKIEHHLNLCL